MRRLSAEMPPAHLAFDVALAPAQKSGVDTSMMGVFDEALRQAVRSDPRPVCETQDTHRATKPRTDERDDREADEVRSAEREETPAAESETRPSERRDEAEPGGDPSKDQVASEEQSESDDTEEAEASSAAAAPEVAEVVAVVSEVVPTVVAEAGQEPSEGETLAATPVGGEAAEPVAKTAGMQAASVMGVNVPGEQPTGQTEGEAASQATELTGETVVTKGEDKADEEESAAKEQKGIGKRIEGESEPETSVAEGAEKSEASSESRVRAGDEPSQERPEKHKSAKHEEKSPGDTAIKTSGERVQSDIPPTSENAASLSIEQPRSEAAESDAATPVAESASTADPGTANSASPASGGVEGGTAGMASANSVQSQVTAGRNSAKENAQGADPAKFVQRVVNAFSAVGERSGSIRLKLYPPELGSLRMEITVKNGTLSARVEAETAAAKSVLVENLPILRERLAEQGIKVTRFDVGVSDQSQGGSSERPDSGGRSFRQGGRDTDSRTDSIPAETDFVDSRGAARLSVDGRLDVFI